MADEVTGVGRICDSKCGICRAGRGDAKWLRPMIMAEYYTLAQLMRLLHVPWPCISREKQTGKKPWQ